MDDSDFPLDDPRYAEFAWRRFRRLLGWMALFAAACAGAAVLVLWWWLGELPLSLWLATSVGIFLTILLAAALMGLMFLSSGTGHDAAVEDFNRDRTDPGHDLTD